jgi:hypothetical protein
MKTPGFFNGVLVALILALVAGAAYAGLGAVFPRPLVLQLIVTVVAGAYVVYLLGRSGEKTGRLATLVGWLLCACGAGLLAPNIAVLLCVHAVMIWLVRALYFHNSVLTALTDLGLCCFALAASVWAVQQSGSLFMAVWCFFLVQALYAVIPATFSAKGPACEPAAPDTFDRAHRAAESAVRRIASLG